MLIVNSSNLIIFLISFATIESVIFTIIIIVLFGVICHYYKKSSQVTTAV